ncbi:hypothetical protein BN000_03203 [Mycobacterium europaeum]|uniref:Uncharacterized protein n=1 Tax=Mycobacterium europaeum TaxID=761804 RepID=A0A0U1DFJ1_9MYCO|nr:hypothetical protein BN000_03203 [Mycobacterium europaeum]
MARNRTDAGRYATGFARVVLISVEARWVEITRAMSKFAVR